MQFYRKAKIDKPLVCGILFNMKGHKIIYDDIGVPLIVSKTIGKIFGRLTSKSFVETYKINGKTKHKILCICECGNETIVDCNNLKKGHTTSCGCYGRERLLKSITKYGKGKIEYNRWLSMISRCHDSDNIKYHNYGGRGITVCDGWKNDFLSFYEDLGKRPSGLTLERMENDLGYNCGHCEYCIKNNLSLNVKWATREEQARNKRTTRFYEYDGVKKIALDWALHFGFSIDSVHVLSARLKRGWSMKKAIETPINKYKKC